MLANILSTRDLSNNAVDIWTFNEYNAETILAEVPIQELGRLVVWFGQKILTPREITMMKRSHSTVDLNLGSDLALATNTRFLLGASQRQKGDDNPLTTALIERSKPSRDLGHGGNEQWLFPLKSLELGVITSEEFLEEGSSV